jgi:photosystem II stability/assembly factor-like uncharacterized protein
VLCGVCISAVASAVEVGEASQRPALVSSQISQAVLLGSAVTGSKRLVAVGERGLVLLSDDGGSHWRQAVVPSSVTLTSVRFAGEQGVAVGHGGVVLTSADGGEHWLLRLDGRRAAELALQAAQADNDPAAISTAEQLVQEGPDKPFLDAAIRNDGRLLVIGAYGMIFASPDLGQTWNAWMSRMDNPDGLHLYAIRQRDNELLIAGERGLVLRSVDDGLTFKRLPTPYKGSLFTAELAGDHNMVVAGLKGSLLRSHDGGATWEMFTAADASSFTGSTLANDGSLYLVTQAGHLLGLQSGGLVQLSQQPLPSLNSVASVNGQSVLLLSNRGWTTVQLDARMEGSK